jgi:hypothetical protein
MWDRIQSTTTTSSTTTITTTTIDTSKRRGYIRELVPSGMPLLCIVQKRHAAFYKFSNFNTTMLLHSRNGLQRKKKKKPHAAFCTIKKPHAAVEQTLYYTRVVAL